jgi:hypothetical protein
MPCHRLPEVEVGAQEVVRLTEEEDNQKTGRGSSATVQGVAPIHPITLKVIDGKGEVIVEVEDASKIGHGVSLMLHLSLPIHQPSRIS